MDLELFLATITVDHFPFLYYASYSTSRASKLSMWYSFSASTEASAPVVLSLFFVLVTLYQLLRELLRMGKIASYTRQRSSGKTQRLSRPQAPSEPKVTLAGAGGHSSSLATGNCSATV